MMEEVQKILILASLFTVILLLWFFTAITIYEAFAKVTP